MSENVVLSEMGKRLRDAAQHAGLSLRELGDLMGVSRPTIYAYASGALRMSQRRLRQAAEFTGRPVEYFAPRTVSDLDPNSPAAQTIRLIDALMGPPSPKLATETAKGALSNGSHADSPGVRAEILYKLGHSLAQTGDYVTAVRHLESAYNIFLDEEGNVNTASCLQTLGFCYLALGQIDRARESFNTALTLQPEVKKWRTKIAIVALTERIGEYKEAEQLLSDMLDDPQLPEVALTYVRANYASNICARGLWKSGLSQTETALTSAYQTGSSDQVMELLIQSAQALTYLGRLDDAVIAIIRAKDVAFAIRDEARATLAEACVGLILMAFGDYSGARDKVNQAYASALQGQYRRTESFCLQILAELALIREDFVSAREIATQLKGHSIANQYVSSFAMGNIVESIASAKLGKLEGAQTCLKQAQISVHKIGDGRIKMMLTRAEYFLAEARNMPEDAEKAYFEMLDQLEKLGLKTDRKLFLSQLAEKSNAVSTENETEMISLSRWKKFLSTTDIIASSNSELGD